VAVYLSAERIKDAINRAGSSKAKAALLDFLIVKRTLKLKASPSVAIVESEPAFLRALDELAGCGGPAGQAAPPERAYLNIFSITDAKQGFRSSRYSSNGTNSTIGRSIWGNVIRTTADKPRKASFQPDYEAHLEALVLAKSSREPLPSLDDVAVWYRRRDALDGLIGTVADAQARFQKLRDDFVAQLGLTTGEISCLFDSKPAPVSDAAFVTRAADPTDYLPSVQVNLAVTPATIAGVCSLTLVQALAAKPFVILTGPSGTGKSRAALKLAEGLRQAASREVKGSTFQLVPVGPDWTSPKRLLGFRTPFGELRTRADGTQTNDSYEITETLRLMLRASHPSSIGVPYFLVLDEMNLSHVERYFAPFLSLMEAANILDEDDAAPLVDPQSLETINDLLQREDPSSDEAQSAKSLVDNGHNLKFPSNLFFIGTVNVDETTYMFSPKVLDRAHVIEIETQKPGTFLNRAGIIEPGGVIELEQAANLLRASIDDREGQRYEASNPSLLLDRLALEADLTPAEINDVRAGVIAVLDGCYELLTPVGFPLGFRTTKEFFVYVYVWIKSRFLLGDDKVTALSRWPEAVDRAVLQKILPKIHGNKRTLGDSLRALGAFLGGGDNTSAPAARYTLGSGVVIEIAPGAALKLPGGATLPLSKARSDEMHTRLSATGFVSFVS
jgi:hypothetical protein